MTGDFRQAPVRRSPRGPRPSSAQDGAALVLVLVVALLLGLAALALTFTVTLDSLEARHAQDAALAAGQAEGGLALATRSLYLAPDAAAAEAQTRTQLQRLGWSVQIDRDPVASGVVRLRATARVGGAGVVRSADVAFGSAIVRLRARD